MTSKRLIFRDRRKKRYCSSICFLDCTAQSTYLENHDVCPLVRIGAPNPLFHKRVCTTPRNQRGGGHSPADEEVGLSQVGRLKKKPSTLSTLIKKKRIFSPHIKYEEIQKGAVAKGLEEMRSYLVIY